MKRTSWLLGLCAVLVSSPALADDICHYEGTTGRYVAIRVSPKAVAAHVVQHGDTPAASWYADTDGDGYGSGPVVSQCPADGLVTNAADCDAGSGTVHPGAPEDCTNTVDDNCNGIVNDGCTPAPVTCPCFTAESLLTHFPQTPMWWDNPPEGSETTHEYGLLLSSAAGLYWARADTGQFQQCFLSNPQVGVVTRDPQGSVGEFTDAEFEACIDELLDACVALSVNNCPAQEGAN